MYKRFFVGLGSFKERGKGAKGSEENFLILMETWASWKQRKRREVEGSEVTSMQFLEHFSQVMVSPKAEAPIWVLYLSGSCVSADAVHSTLLEAANLEATWVLHPHRNGSENVGPGMPAVMLPVARCKNGVFSWYYGILEASEEQEGWSVGLCEMLTTGGRRED